MEIRVMNRAIEMKGNAQEEELLSLELSPMEDKLKGTGRY